ncbi:uncharacterized protein FA14DRAFT_162533 [Meira miltonrushii]|uniref:Zn(2)-C6 fungal-type domain-containing protein n=1 Tax=Meira miltonrushii TaxID=1280837 RepID=A0A316V1U9_9BASI|nr:uncharacterized protein FA14DRAFT_162533 [Meira miltonrushii]PWN31516.1 hypothetical protein FA14DRAFT_162533 [Meira miltonrushii]
MTTTYKSTEYISRYGLPRSSLACLACRNAKSKCDGLIPSVIATRPDTANLSEDVRAEVNCSRCARLHLECKWRPCQRNGRPVKKRKLIPENQPQRSSDNETEINSSQDDAMLDSILFSDDSMRMISNLLDNEFILHDQDTLPLSTESHQTHSPAEQMAEIQKRILDASSPAKQYHPMPLSPSTVSTNDALHQGISRFFSGVGLALPLFDSKEELLEEAEYCDALLYTAATLGHALYEGHEGLSCTKMRKEATQKIDASIFLECLMFSPDRHRGIVHLSALTLMIYIAYAMNDTSGLQKYVEQARTAALTLNLYSLGNQNMENTELARKVWWELYVIDCIMDVMTNGNIKRQFDGIRTTIPFPGAAKNDKEIQSVWDLRVRSVSLLAGTFTMFARSKDEERLWTADKIQANIIAEAQGMLLSAMQARMAGDTDCKLNRKLTILFDCLMMLYAGRVHLHRLFWFEDLNLSFASCSFQREKINDLSQNTPAPLGIANGSLIASSVEKIVQSSDSILHLMQMDTDAFFKYNLAQMQSRSNLTNDLLPITSSHWPPIGCCQMVASFGLAVHMASKGAEDELRAQQSVSSIGMAEASLGILTKVWPIAGYYRQELHQFRLLISQTLSTNELS